MTTERIRLLDLEETDGPEIELPSGRVTRVRLFDASDYQLWQRIMADVREGGSASAADAQVLLQRAIPDLTAEERETLSPRMIWFIGQAGARKADALIEELRKNGLGLAPPNAAPAPGDAASTPGPSRRKTKSRTSAPKSGGSAAASG